MLEERTRNQTIHIVVRRIVILLSVSVGIGLLAHRVRRSPEQEDLTQFVAVQLPSLLNTERDARATLERLGEKPGLTPVQARALLIDEAIPKLIRLKHQAEGLSARTFESEQLKREYVHAVDELTDAARACVRVIDDPKLPEGAGLTIIRERFAFVEQVFASWDAHVRQACVRHRLAPPDALHKAEGKS